MQVRGDGRNPSMLYFAHSAGCEECQRYVADLLGQKDAFEVWGGRLLVIVPEESGAEGFPASATFPVHLLVDEGGTLARRCGIEGAGLVVADAWGEVHFTTRVGDGHDLPTGPEVEEWLKFLAIQCPECEQPEGLWRSI
jgi:peroxiredoxin